MASRNPTWRLTAPSAAADMIWPADLAFTITDDGTGFDTATTQHGTGLQEWPTG